VKTPPHPTALRAAAVSLQGASVELSELLGVLTFPVFIDDTDLYVHVSPVCPNLDTLDASVRTLREALVLLDSTLSWCQLCSSRSSASFFTDAVTEAATLVRLEALAETVQAGSGLRLLGLLHEQYVALQGTAKSASSLAKEYVLRSLRSTLSASAVASQGELAELAATSTLLNKAPSVLHRTLLELVADERLDALENLQRLAAVSRRTTARIEDVAEAASAIKASVTALAMSPTYVVLCGVKDRTSTPPPHLVGPAAALFALDDVCVLAVPEVVAFYAKGAVPGTYRAVSATSQASAEALAASVKATWGLLRSSLDVSPEESLEAAIEAATALLS
jgi:hypothetical protein